MTKTLKAVVAAFALMAGATGGLAIAAGTPKAPKEVVLTVTTEGFQPEEIKVKKGEPLRLVITRKTDKTCAKDIIIKDLGIKKALPLNEAVTVDLTPTKDGRLRYACKMDMITGVIVVE